MSDHPKHEQLSAYYDAALSAAEMNNVQGHIQQCAVCGAYLKQITALSGALQAGYAENPSPDLEIKIKRYEESAQKKGGSVMKKNTFVMAGISSTVFVAVMAFVLNKYMPPVTQVSHEAALMSQQEVVAEGKVLSATTKVEQKTAAAVVSVAPVPQQAGVANRQQETVAAEKLPRMDAESGERVARSMAPAMDVANRVRLKKQIIFQDALASNGITGGARLESVFLDGKMAKKDGMDLRDQAMPSAAYCSVPIFRAGREANTESYDKIVESSFLSVSDQPLSTFSIDVDSAAYTNVRRFLNQNQMPPKEAVRIEEMINYFSYDYPQPAGSDPVSITTSVAPCPWKKGHELVMVGIQAQKIDLKDAPASNLVFLVDVSGSMDEPNKLPLVKSALRLLVDQLRSEDKISIVVYSGTASIVLEGTGGNKKERILEALDRLQAGGSTAGGAGIKLAYDTAKKHFIRKGNNRVILATDGDFNVGASSDAEMTKLIEERREDGVFLNVLGFGQDNYKDSKMEALADKGNGQAAYIDNLLEAKKVFISQLGATLFTVAKDVKIQVEFNPAKVKGYRLIGYENRALNNADFNDDKKDAGEMGSGHSVTALYEIVPAGSKEEVPGTDALKYQRTDTRPSNDLMTVKVRYKEPQGDVSKLLSKEVPCANQTEISGDMKFASAVAEFGLLLRNSEHKGEATYADVIKRAIESKGADVSGSRAEFVKLAEMAEILDKSKKTD